MAGLEVARRQCLEAVEDEQVGDRTEFAVLLGRRAERLGRQLLGERDRASGIGERRAAVAADGDGLDPLGPEHGPEAAAAGVATGVAEVGERHQSLARRADGGNLPVGTVLGPQAFFRGVGRQTPQVAGGSPRHPRLVDAGAVDEQDTRFVA